MYKDGHEWEDVVEDWAGFLKQFAEYEHQMELYDRDGAIVKEPNLLPGENQLQLYTHDESTFHANDCWKTKWTHKDKDMVPQPKDSGVSIMVSEFLSPDEGRQTHKGRWVALSIVMFKTFTYACGEAQILFKAGQNCEGYIENERNLLLLTCRRLCTGASLTLKNDVFNMLMRFFTLNLATQQLQLASAGWVTSYITIMIKFDATGPPL